MTTLLASTAAGAARRRQPRGPVGLRPDVEGLRAVAILLVVLGHVGVPFATGGYVGVDVFFVISGFLITAQLLRDQVPIHVFYARRALRLLPVSAVVLTVTLIAARLWLSPLLIGQLTRDALAAASYVANLLFAARGTDYLAADADPSPFQHFWSLAVEEQFYLLWPLLLTVVARGRRRALAVALAGLVLASLTLSVTETYRSAPWAYFGTHTRVWELAAGALLAVYGRRLTGRRALVAGVLGLAGIVTAAVAYDADTAYPGALAVLPVAGAVAVIAGRGDRLLDYRPLRTVGRLSYGWYLWHWPVLMIAPAALHRSGGPAERLALAGAALGLAWLTHHLVENPIRYHQGLRSRARYGLLVGAAASVTVIATSVAIQLWPPAVLPGAAAPDLAQTLDHAPSPDRALADAVTAGAALGPVPANLRPALTAADQDVPRVYGDGCHLTAPMIRVPAGCAYGDTASAATVVLFGDSHAAQWFPALERLSVEHRWRLVSLTKSSCTAADVPVWSTTLRRPYTECQTWRRAALARIADLRPRLVVVSSTFAYRPVGPAGATATSWREAWLRTLTGLTRTGARVAVITDTPVMGIPVPVCLSQHLRAASACSRPVGVSRRQIQLRVLSDLAGTDGITVIDPLPWLCADVCPAVIGNRLVYRDASHLTTPMSAALAPVLDAALGGVNRPY